MKRKYVKPEFRIIHLSPDSFTNRCEWIQSSSLFECMPEEKAKIIEEELSRMKAAGEMTVEKNNSVANGNDTSCS